MCLLIRGSVFAETMPFLRVFVPFITGDSLQMPQSATSRPAHNRLTRRLSGVDGPAFSHH